MRRILLMLILLITLILSACSGNVSQPASAPPVENESEPDTAVAPEQPSESEETLPVASKPQLIEFYADW